MKINQLKNNDKIYLGDKLFIPLYDNTNQTNCNNITKLILLRKTIKLKIKRKIIITLICNELKEKLYLNLDY